MRGMFPTSSLEPVRRSRGERAVAAVVRDARLEGAKLSAMRKVPLDDFHVLRRSSSRPSPAAP